MANSATSQVKARARQIAGAYGGRGKKKPWVAPKKEKGRRFDWSHPQVLSNLKKVLDKHLTSTMSKELGMDRKQIELTLHELRERVSGTKASIDQLVGTFFEIAGSEHPEVHSLRQDLCVANVLAALQSMFLESEVFMTAGSDITLAVKMEDILSNIHWRAGDETAKKFVAEFTSKNIPKGQRLLDESMEKRLLAAVDPDSIHHLRDFTIGPEKYCDRATLLKLANGRWLLLLSEEYKTPGSGGMTAQQAIRNNRLFNSNVAADTELAYFDMAGNRQTIALGKLLLNCDTVGNDQLGIKAARRESIQARVLKVSRKIRERKKKYGELVRTGSQSNTIFFLYRLPYPNRLVRAMLIDAFHAMPK